MTTKIKMLCAEFAEWIIRQEQWQEDRGDALSLPADEQENGHKPPELPVVGEQQDTTQIRINHLTFKDCERLAGEGCLAYMEGKTRIEEFNVAWLDQWGLGYLYEVHCGMTQDEVLDRRRNQPERLEYDSWRGVWDCCGDYEYVPPIERILVAWRADHYRLKAETQETKQETEQ